MYICICMCKCLSYVFNYLSFVIFFFLFLFYYYSCCCFAFKKIFVQKKNVYFFLSRSFVNQETEKKNQTEIHALYPGIRTVFRHGGTRTKTCFCLPWLDGAAKAIHLKTHNVTVYICMCVYINKCGQSRRQHRNFGRCAYYNTIRIQQSSSAYSKKP